MNRILDIISKHHTICWYPSAGADFRGLLFLSEPFFEWKHVPIEMNTEPDLFILSDCNPQNTVYGNSIGRSFIDKLNSDYFNTLSTIYIDPWTKMFVTESIEIINGVDVPFNQDFYRFEVSPAYGKAYYFKVHIESNILGEWDKDVLYVISENTSFAVNVLIRNRIPIMFLIKVRYGDQFGESTISGNWLQKSLGTLQTRYYLSNEVANDAITIEDRSLLEETFPGICMGENISLEKFYRTPEETWSNQGDIIWYKVL